MSRFSSSSGFGHRLREAREALSLSQKELAARIRCSRESISQWEHGIHVPSHDYRKLLSQALGVSVDFLRTGRQSGPIADEAAYAFAAFLSAKTPDDLIQAAQNRAWERGTLYAIRNSTTTLEKLTHNAASAAIQAFRNGDAECGAFLATIPAVSAAAFDPDAKILDELERIVRRAMRQGQVVLSYPLQVAASILAQKGKVETARDCLRWLLKEPELREREWEAMASYYGSHGNRYSAYFEHLRLREGSILAAWDLPSLLVDLGQVTESVAEEVTAPLIRRQLKQLMRFDGRLAAELASEVDACLLARTQDAAS